MNQANGLDNLDKDLRPLTRALEKTRKRHMAWLITGIGVASFAVTFLLLYFNPQGIDLKYTVTLGAFLPSLLLYLTLNRAYMHKGKRQLIKGLCEASGFRYRDDGCFAVSAMDKHRILPPHNKSRLADGIQGRHRDIPIDIQEVVLTELKQDPGHKKKQKEYLRFWGLLIRVSLSRPLNGHTVVIPHAAMQTFFRAYFSKYLQVKMPIDNFTKRYEVMSSDVVEAKVLLNGSFREQFSTSGKAMNAYWSEASFRDTEVLLAYQRFQPLFNLSPLWKPVTERTLRDNIDGLRALARVLDALKANAQVGV